MPPILPLQDGFLFLDRSKFAASFAADVDPDLAAFMTDSQVPWGVKTLEGVVSESAWKSKPSWYLIATDDRISPSADVYSEWDFVDGKVDNREAVGLVAELLASEKR